MDEGGIVWPKLETLPCRDCKWGKWLCKFQDDHCAKYKKKPNDVYYESMPCPKYEKDTSDKKDAGKFLDLD